LTFESRIPQIWLVWDNIQGGLYETSTVLSLHKSKEFIHQLNFFFSRKTQPCVISYEFIV
jgi:hypothetical protein